MKENNTEYNTKKQKSKEETSLLLSIADINILQIIFIQLVNGYKYSIYDKQEIKKAFTLLLNFSLSCKLFCNISKQPLFPLILNNININLNYKKYLKILHVEHEFEQQDDYKEGDITDMFYETCLLGYYDLVNTLMKYGANINCRQKNSSYTPLLSAVVSRRIKIIQKLIKRKELKIDKPNLNQKTALMLTIILRKENIVTILLSRKDINLTLKDSYGKTCFDLAKNSTKLYEMLENYQNSNLK